MLLQAIYCSRRVVLCRFVCVAVLLLAHCCPLSATVSADSALIRALLVAKDSVERNPSYSAAVAADVCTRATAAKDWAQLARGKNVLATAMQRLGRNREAITIFRDGLVIARRHQLRREQADIMLNLGAAHENNGDYRIAMQYLEAALAEFAAMKDTLSMGNCHQNMGVLVLHMDDYTQATGHFHEAVAMYTAMADTMHIVGAYIGIGGCQIRTGQYREALATLLKAMSLGKSMGWDESAALSNMNIALCYHQLNMADSALIYYNRAERIFSRLAASENEVLLYINKGSVYDELLHQPQPAIVCYQKGLALARKINYPIGVSYACESLAEAYSAAGDYKHACEYLNIHMKTKDTLLNKEKVDALQDMAARYKTRELTSKQQLLQKEKDLQLQRLRNKDVYVYSGFGSAILVLIAGGLAVRYYRLHRARQRVALEQKQLQAHMNPQFIFNCLATIKHFVAANDRTNANRYLADFALLMRQTLDNSRDEVVSLQREIEYLTNYISFWEVRFPGRFSWAVQCAPDVDPYTAQIPAMMVQPFVENALKYAVATTDGGGSVLLVRFYQRGNGLWCRVEDDGPGMAVPAGSWYRRQQKGIALTRRRLAQIARRMGGSYALNIISKAQEGSGAGTIIDIKFPIEV